MQVDIVQSAEAWSRTRRQRRVNFLSLLQLGHHLPLPSDVATPGSLAFGLRHTSSAPLVLTGFQTLSIPETRTFGRASQPTQSSGGQGLSPYWLEVSECHLCLITVGL